MALSIASLGVPVGGKPVLDDISLTVGDREIVGVIGAPGCGKSTLMRAIFGLVRPSSGKVVYQGEDITGRSPIQNIRGGVVLVAQGGQVFRALPVEENLLLSGSTLDAKRALERVDAIYGILPRLKERRRQLAGSLSGGERQMLALGMGLVPEPRLMLLDEPSTGLSPLMTDRMLDKIRELAERLGCAALIVEQNVKNALLVSHRVLVLKRGRIGYAHDVRAEPDPKHLLDAYAFVETLGQTGHWAGALLQHRSDNVTGSYNLPSSLQAAARFADLGGALCLADETTLLDDRLANRSEARNKLIASDATTRM